MTSACFDEAGPQGIRGSVVLGRTFEDHFVDVNGIRMHYVAGGSGPTMLFVHGFPTLWYTWRNQLREFGRDHRVVAPDMRGFNLTSKPRAVPHYGIRILVDDLRALVEHLGGEPVEVVGDDWGGLVSWAFALYYPELVKRLVILSSPHPAIFDRELRENPMHQQASQYLLALRMPTAEEIVAGNDFAVLRESILELDFFADEDREVYLRSWRQPGGLSGALNWYRHAWLGPPSGDGMPPHGNYVPELLDQTVRPRTLVIKASGCPYFLDSTLRGLEQHVPDVTIRRVETRSHWIAEEQPDAVSAHIREFLAR